jgi:hypothetical protein
MLQLVRIQGNSIAPYLQDGEYAVLLKRRWLRKPLCKGDFVVFNEKTHGTMIKQIASQSPDGSQLFMRGLDDFSTDSRLFGAISLLQVKGKVIYRIRTKKSAAS